MTREDFGEALLRFGPDLERWPGNLAQSAKGLVGDDPVAARPSWAGRADARQGRGGPEHAQQAAGG